MCTVSWHNFIDLQMKLIPYRVVRMREEWAYIKTGGVLWNYVNPTSWTLKTFIREGRFLIRLLAFYMLCIMMSRESVFPLMEPGSPFYESVQYRNPNF